MNYESPNVTMLATVEHVNVGTLAARWWVPVVRGIAAILFGIVSIVMPRITVFALIVLWGAYALVDGVFNLALAARAERAGRRWGWLLVEAIVSVLAGVVAFAWPGITAVALLSLIAVWAVFRGVAEIAAAIRLRFQIRNEWMLVTSGVLSILVGLLLLLFPGAGVLALVWMIGGYAMVFGALLIALGVRLHRWARSLEHTTSTGGIATPV